MSDVFEIAYAVASKRLCLITGTGFSKSITDNQMPSWQQLLESLCDLMKKDGDALKASLFPKKKNNPLNLEESAQVIALSLRKNDMDINNEVAKIIKSVELKGDNDSIIEFFRKRKARVITTNYDKLIEEMAGNENCHSLFSGIPVPHRNRRVEVYHVHGSVDFPESMIVTSSHYFRFNLQSYYSSKLNTLLHENTVVILGYSLSDMNLKTIINSYNHYSQGQGVSLNIFFIARSSVEQPVKDFYGYTYGIRVIDNMEVEEFFDELNQEIPKAKSILKTSQKNIKKVLFEGKHFTSKYLRMEYSFYEITSSIRAIGVRFDDPQVVNMLGKIIEKKIELTHENDAWGQYVQLADWLIYLACYFQIKGTTIENIYLEGVLSSMTTMSKKLYLGYSWHAYKSWRRGWRKITFENREMIKEYIKEETGYADALRIVRL